MKTEAPVGMERLLPAFHGQSARILAYLAARGSTTPEDITKELGIPRSTVYKLLTQLVATGLAHKRKVGKTEKVSVPDFVFYIKNTAYIGEMKVTPRNVIAFDAAHTPAGKMFIGKHGQDAFAKFVELYDNYERGNLTAQLMARDLGVTRYEVELLLTDVRSIDPVEIKV
ncbi:MAG: MarR family transcriptional regulator [Thaumarchaeota archaeon]|nr:MarR family transcriptional regulator [Nitrososphaerota archaeon]